MKIVLTYLEKIEEFELESMSEFAKWMSEQQKRLHTELSMIVPNTLATLELDDEFFHVSLTYNVMLMISTITDESITVCAYIPNVTGKLRCTTDKRKSIAAIANNCSINKIETLVEVAEDIAIKLAKATRNEALKERLYGTYVKTPQIETVKLPWYIKAYQWALKQF